jgi:hypothetical protein
MFSELSYRLKRFKILLRARRIKSIRINNKTNRFMELMREYEMNSNRNPDNDMWR